MAEAYLQEDYIFIFLFPLKATRLKNKWRSNDNKEIFKIFGLFESNSCSLMLQETTSVDVLEFLCSYSQLLLAWGEDEDDLKFKVDWKQEEWFAINTGLNCADTDK